MWCYYIHIDLHLLYYGVYNMRLMVHQQGMHDLQDIWNEVPQLNFFTKDKENSWRIQSFVIFTLCKYYIQTILNVKWNMYYIYLFNQQRFMQRTWRTIDTSIRAWECLREGSSKSSASWPWRCIWCICRGIEDGVVPHWWHCSICPTIWQQAKRICIPPYHLSHGQSILSPPWKIRLKKDLSLSQITTWSIWASLSSNIHKQR